MAEAPQSAPQMMKETQEKLDTSVENGDETLVENEEEETEREPGYLEERFRVDRRKLEQMIQGRMCVYSI